MTPSDFFSAIPAWQYIGYSIFHILVGLSLSLHWTYLIGIHRAHKENGQKCPIRFCIACLFDLDFLRGAAVWSVFIWPVVYLGKSLLFGVYLIIVVAMMIHEYIAVPIMKWYSRVEKAGASIYNLPYNSGPGTVIMNQGIPVQVQRIERRS